MPLRSRQLAGIILASALITFEGTAITVALPTIGHSLPASVFQLQWISNAALLALAALLLPAGMLADRHGRIPTIRAGVIVFAAASVASATAGSAVLLIAARCVQGIGAALILPAALASLRSAYADETERTRIFGVWAAWTGLASVAGPLLAGGAIQAWSWRAVPLAAAAGAAVAGVLLQRHAASEAQASSARFPVVATIALVLTFGGAAYLLSQAGGTGQGAWLLLPALVAGSGLAVLVRHPDRHLLLPPELLTARNILPASAVTFALYFGMFGVSFLLVLYVQQVLQHSAFWAAVVVLPISVMLLFAERLGRLAAVIGATRVIAAGTVCAAAAVAWLGVGRSSLAFWPYTLLGTALLGLGMSLAVSALTHAAVVAVPNRCAGAASGLNHGVVRVAGLAAVALLGSIAAPADAKVVSLEGVHRALLVCAVIVAAGGVVGGALLRDDQPGGLPATGAK